MECAFLNKQQIAERFGTSANIASRLLSENGVSPVDLGPGRCRGLRWFAPAVEAVIRQMHDDAQPKDCPTKKKRNRPVHSGIILGRSVNDLYAELTGDSKVQ